MHIYVCTNVNVYVYNFNLSESIWNLKILCKIMIQSPYLCVFVSYSFLQSGTTFFANLNSYVLRNLYLYSRCYSIFIILLLLETLAIFRDLLRTSFSISQVIVVSFMVDLGILIWGRKIRKVSSLLYINMCMPTYLLIFLCKISFPYMSLLNPEISNPNSTEMDCVNHSGLILLICKTSLQQKKAYYHRFHP